MKRYSLTSDEYSYSLPDDRTMHRWTAKQGRLSTPKGVRKAAGTLKAKALIRKLGL